MRPIFSDAAVGLGAPPRLVQRVEGLPLRIDADVRIVLQHAARQVTADRLQHVIGDAEFRQFGDHRVPQVVEPEAGQTGGVPEHPPGRVPLQHRLRGVVAPPLARWPQEVIRLAVPEQIGTLDHPGYRREGRRVEWYHAVTRLVLAPADVDELLHEVDIAPAEVLHLHRAHGRVRGDDGRAVDVLPLGI